MTSTAKTTFNFPYCTVSFNMALALFRRRRRQLVKVGGALRLPRMASSDRFVSFGLPRERQRSSPPPFSQDRLLPHLSRFTFTAGGFVRAPPVGAQTQALTVRAF